MRYAPMLPKRRKAAIPTHWEMDIGRYEHGWRHDRHRKETVQHILNNSA
jgi:hypothetical protein